MGKVTIEDISRQTGLSRGTVSRALNDRPDISEQTKQRVLEACRKLNFLPSHAARTLATGRNFALAVIVSDLRSTFNIDFLRGALTQAERAHYVLNIVELGTTPQSIADRLAALAADRVDGVLLVALLDAAPAKDLLGKLGARPLIACHTGAAAVGDVLAPDYAESGRMIARLLLGDARRACLYVHSPQPFGAQDALTGFQTVCRERGVNPDDCVVILNAEQRSAPALADALRPHISRVSALAGTDDTLALNLMMACQKLGREPGKDIAVVGQGNACFASHTLPSLSTIDLSGYEIGERAFETAAQRLDKSRMDAPQTTYVAPRLIERESTRCLGG